MNVPKIISILMFNESRKVCFGMWLFFAAIALLVKAFINSEQWMLCVAASSALIGGGTIADTYMAKKAEETAAKTAVAQTVATNASPAI
jgi:hypothetical protein